MSKSLTYASVVAVLNRDTNPPAPVGMSMWNPDAEPWHAVKNNDEAIVVLEVGPNVLPALEDSPVEGSSDFGGTQVWDPSPPQDMSSVDDNPVADDWAIEIVALDQNRLSELMQWVGMQLVELCPPRTNLAQYVGFQGMETIEVGGVTKYVNTTLRENQVSMHEDPQPGQVVSEDAAVQDQVVSTDPTGAEMPFSNQNALPDRAEGENVEEPTDEVSSTDTIDSEGANVDTSAEGGQ